jgi:hypothetical protein
MTAIAAVNRCATQNQVQRRVFPQPLKAVPLQSKIKTGVFPQPAGTFIVKYAANLPL